MTQLASERKFIAAGSRGALGAALLGHTCRPDPLFPAARVLSIYFDSPYLASYEEKRNGDFVKTKVRLRWYEEEGDDAGGDTNAFLEVKRRVGNGREKHRAPLRLSRAWLSTVLLDDPSLARLPFERSGAFRDLVPPAFLPTLVISYRRRRWVCPSTGARVCLDTGIGSERTNSRLLPRAAPVRLDTAVLEIKGAPADDTPWLEELYRHGFRQRSFSKYGACVEHIREGAA